MKREFFTSVPKGFECEVRFYCSTCQEEVLEDDFKTHKCQEYTTQWRKSSGATAEDSFDEEESK